jgi:hypothetical protein
MINKLRLLCGKRDGNLAALIAALVWKKNFCFNKISIIIIISIWELLWIIKKIGILKNHRLWLRCGRMQLIIRVILMNRILWFYKLLVIILKVQVRIIHIILLRILMRYWNLIFLIFT